MVCVQSGDAPSPGPRRRVRRLAFARSPEGGMRCDRGGGGSRVGRVDGRLAGKFAI